MPGDMLLVYGRAIPRDALIVELINPAGRLVHRAQVDVEADGTYTRIILTFPKPDDINFIQGTYTIAARSAVRQDLVQSRLFIFQQEQMVQDGGGSGSAGSTGSGIGAGAAGQEQASTRRLEIRLSAPQSIGISEHARVLARVTLDGILLRSDAGALHARLIMPDSRVREIIFDVVDDGIFTADIQGEVPGEHVLIARVIYNEIVAYDAISILVQENPVLTLSSELARLNSSIDNLSSRLDGFIMERAEKDRSLEDSIARLSDSNGQMLSLLLPIVAMIMVVVALQATILARRSR